jgi:hypothetical protein
MSLAYTVVRFACSMTVEMQDKDDVAIKNDSIWQFCCDMLEKGNVLDSMYCSVMRVRKVDMNRYMI